MRIIQPLRLVSNPDAANRLGLHGIEVASTEVIRFVDEKQPYAFQRISFPPALLGPLKTASKSWTKAEPVSFVAVINALIPSGIASAVQEITAIECPADVAPILKCDVGKSVLLVRRMYVDFEGKAVELVASCYHPERYSYRIELERAPIANDRGSGL
jgi:DNA-binding GntR family transcriptional regulator